jgi:hypothetical protein
MKEKIKKNYDEQNNKYDFNKYFNDKRILVALMIITYLSYKLKEYM